MQRKDCRHRLTNTVLPAFYLIQFFEEKKKDIRIADAQASPTLAYMGFESFSNFHLSVIMCGTV